MTTKEKIMQVFSKTLVGKRIGAEMIDKWGRCSDNVSFIVESVSLEEDKYVTAYSKKEENKRESLEIWKAIVLADTGTVGTLGEKGCRVVYLL